MKKHVEQSESRKITRRKPGSFFISIAKTPGGTGTLAPGHCMDVCHSSGVRAGVPGHRVPRTQSPRQEGLLMRLSSPGPGNSPTASSGVSAGALRIRSFVVFKAVLRFVRGKRTKPQFFGHSKKRFGKSGAGVSIGLKRSQTCMDRSLMRNQLF